MAAKDRLRWRCRRGLRELDLLLTEFLDKGYNSLSETEKEDFETLLSATDEQLLRWLTGRTQSDDPAMSSIILRITATRTNQ